MVEELKFDEGSERRPTHVGPAQQMTLRMLAIAQRPSNAWQPKHLRLQEERAEEKRQDSIARKAQRLAVAASIEPVTVGMRRRRQRRGKDEGYTAP